MKHTYTLTREEGDGGSIHVSTEGRVLADAPTGG